MTPWSQPVSVQPGNVTLGIETEFILAPRDKKRFRNVADFSRSLVEGYQSWDATAGAHKTRPGMHSALVGPYTGQEYSEWSIDDDITIEGDDADGAVENISPIFVIKEGSQWRSHVTVMWEYLRTTQDIITNETCGTHVHVSFDEGWTLTALKRLCQSILYFEPAFEALLPTHRLRNEYAKSNSVDNSNFRKLPQQDCFAAIERCAGLADLALLMNPDDPHTGNEDKMFGWNLRYILKRGPKGTIEFRRGAGSSRKEHAFMWIELAISFVSAAVKQGVPDILKTIKPDISGLRAFIEQANLPTHTSGLYAPQYLNELYRNKNGAASRQPVPLGELPAKKRQKLAQKHEQDKHKTVMLTKLDRAPAWT